MSDEKTTRLAKITDVELLRLLKAGTVKLALVDGKNKKKGVDAIYQQLQWRATGLPLLIDGGYIEVTGRLVFAVQPREKRNTGQFKKVDGDLECECTWGTKHSGTFGELMLFLNDVAFKEAVKEYTATRPTTNPPTLHIASQFCKKKLGSPGFPCKDPEKAKAYLAAEDWHFKTKVRFVRMPNKETGVIEIVPAFFEVVKYVVEKVKGKQTVVEKPIVVTVDDIHKTFTRNTLFKVCMTLGATSTKTEAQTNADGAEIPVIKYSAQFNMGHHALLQYGTSGSGTVKPTRSEDEMKQYAAMLAGSSPAPADGEDEDNDGNGGDDDDDQAGAQPTPTMPTASGSTAVDITAQLAAFQVK
jgi:hypothetical protein